MLCHSILELPMRADVLDRREPLVSRTMRGFLWGPTCVQTAFWRQPFRPLQSGLLRQESTRVRCVTVGGSSRRARRFLA